MFACSDIKQGIHHTELRLSIKNCTVYCSNNGQLDNHHLPSFVSKNFQIQLNFYHLTSCCCILKVFFLVFEISNIFKIFIFLIYCLLPIRYQHDTFSVTLWNVSWSNEKLSKFLVGVWNLSHHKNFIAAHMRKTLSKKMYPKFYCSSKMHFKLIPTRSSLLILWVHPNITIIFRHLFF